VTASSHNAPRTRDSRLVFLYFIRKRMLDGDFPVRILQYLAADCFTQRLRIGAVAARDAKETRPPVRMSTIA
jgi:hypothetical protein